jgi:hypothetical protein
MFEATPTRYSPQRLEARDNNWREQPAKKRNNLPFDLTPSEIEIASEGGILRYIGARWSLSHPNDKPANALALIVGCNPATIERAMSDETHLGAIAWMRLGAIDHGLWDAWREIHRAAALAEGASNLKKAEPKEEKP